MNTKLFKILFEYIVFLLTPENSSDLEDSAYIHENSRADSRIHSAIKIFFWIGFSMFFWISLVVALRLLL